MKKVLAHLKPEAVFRYFEEICGIPHGSGNTKDISDYVVDFAKKQGLRYRQDSLHNVILWKNGSTGYENSAPVILQGHLDMVCEKENNCPIDMEKEGLLLELNHGIISAKGTTLGGDDGIAVAYALAILESDDIPHPPLEVIFTVDEETGMTGAEALDCSEIQSRTMLNLDSEDEGFLLAGCAGGSKVTAHFPVEREKIANGTMYNLDLTGMTGGHSGVEIDKGRANACHLLGRTLNALFSVTPFRLIRINGGLKDNAIPRESHAVILIESSDKYHMIQKKMQELDGIYRSEYELSDPGISLQMTPSSATDTQAMTEESTRRVITALTCLPNGIERMSLDIEGLVQTSLNLGILITEDDSVSLSYSLRSSVESEKTALTERISRLTEALGGHIDISGDYPAWEYHKDSPLRDTMVRIFEKKYGRKPVIQAIHAGLECGIFAGKLPGLDCVSFGPDIKNIHTTEESMDTESVARTWEYLLEILRQLK